MTLCPRCEPSKEIERKSSSMVLISADAGKSLNFLITFSDIVPLHQKLQKNTVFEVDCRICSQKFTRTIRHKNLPKYLFIKIAQIDFKETLLHPFVELSGIK